MSCLPARLDCLQELRVVGNQLKILPPMIGKLAQLRVLAADSNQLTILPGGEGCRAPCTASFGCNAMPTVPPLLLPPLQASCGTASCWRS